MGDLILWNATIIDGRNASPEPGMCITVRGDKIVAVSAIRGGRAPETAIDLEGRYVMPGLIDAHIHLGDDPAMLGEMAAAPPLRGAEPHRRELVYFVLASAARAFLRSGVTTIRDVGSYDDNAIILREAIKLGLTDGPDILACGRIVSATAPGAVLFKSMYEEADGPWQIRQCVRNQLRRGADYIKVMAGGARSVLRENPEPAQLTPEEMEALVDEAHRLGVRVAAHAEGLGAVKVAVDAGVDTVEHGLSLHRAPELLDHMARRGIVLVPTLSTFHDVSERIADRFEPHLVEQAKRQKDEAYRTLIAARAAGVVIAMGFDSGPPGSDALELVRMVEGGLTAHEALTAATIGSARALGLTDVGTVESDRRADLVVLDSNPLDDITALMRPAEFDMVLKGGRVVAGDPPRRLVQLK
jgi:imidazolonepropionase-like amidohydrolase